MILVTGATGRLGEQVVRLLRRGGADTRALVRIGSEYYWLNDTGTNYFFGDLRDTTSLTRAVKGCSHVVHTAAVRMESTENHHEVTTLQGTISLIDQAKAAGVQRFVMASCLGAGRELPAARFDCLHKAEQHLQASGMEYTILRFSAFVEEIAELARAVQEKGSAVVWGEADGSISPISRPSAAIYSVASLDHPKAKNAVLEIGGEETMTAKDAISRACAIAQVDTADVRYMGKVGTAVAGKGISLVLGRRWDNWIRQQSLLYGGDMALDSSKIAAAFGIPAGSFEEAVKAHLDADDHRRDPNARDERVVHRQFQATVYEPGEIDYKDLPTGPLKYN